MALIRKVGSIKNANYNSSIEYLTMQHEEITNKKGEILKYEPLYGADGMQMERENYAISYLKSDGEKGNLENWSDDCNETNLKYHKNLNENDRKAHHYVMSFPEEDMKNGLTVEQAQKCAEEFCRENFKGYQALVCTHGDTDNIHCHIVINSARDRTVDQEFWMEKGSNGQIKPSQYEAGGKHTNTPQFRQHLMEKVDEMCKENGLTVENYSDLNKRREDLKENGMLSDNGKIAVTKAQERMEYMHDSVIKAAKNSKNFQELQEKLKKEYNLKIETRGQAIRVYHPEMNKPKRIEHIGLTPHDLTSDMHHYYNKCPHNYEGVKEKWDDPARRFANEYTKKGREYERDPEYGKLQIDEENGEVYRKGWNKSNTFKANSISLYNENGERRSLLEQVYALAYVVINGEMPEHMKTEKQRQAEKRSEERMAQINMPRSQKMQNMKQAIQYTREMKLETPEQLNEKLQSKDLSADDRSKLEFLKKQYELAEDKEFCYSKVLKEREEETKAYTKAQIAAAVKRLEEIHNKENKHTKPKQKERDEYEKEISASMVAADYRVIHEGREREKEKSKGGRTM